MSFYKKAPGSRLHLVNGRPAQSVGCCGSPEPVGSTGGIGAFGLLAVAAIGLVVVFPRVWDNFQKDLWG